MTNKRHVTRSPKSSWKIKFKKSDGSNQFFNLLCTKCAQILLIPPVIFGFSIPKKLVMSQIWNFHCQGAPVFLPAWFQYWHTSFFLSDPTKENPSNIITSGCMIDFKELTLGQRLGQGGYGEVDNQNMLSVFLDTDLCLMLSHLLLLLLCCCCVVVVVLLCCCCCRVVVVLLLK